MHEITREEGNLIRVEVHGKLTQEDYDELIPAWEETIARHGSMRLLLVMENFHGWDLGTAWDDFRFSTEHAGKIERVAAVGEKTWEQWLMKLGSLLPGEDLKYFDMSDLTKAEVWVRS